MTHVNLLRHLIGLTVGAFVALVAFLCVPGQANAQTPFLSSPYYGTTSVTTSYNGTNHAALDLGLSYAQVIAANNATVGQVAWYSNNCHQSGSDSTCGYGLFTRLDYSNGYRTYYAHLSAVGFAIGTTGTAVSRGQYIGTSGTTGWSTGPHLHFETRDNTNTNVDPASLWMDGQFATPSRPLPAPVYTSDAIANLLKEVDDTTDNSAGFSKGSGGLGANPCTGNCSGWTRSTSVGLNGDMYYTLADGNSSADQWAKWIPPNILSWGGVYEIYVYIPSDNATSWQAKYVISHADGTATATVDQEGLSNQWISIGTYRLTSSSYVMTHDASGEVSNQHCTATTYCKLGVDAIQFRRRGTIYGPEVRYDTSWSTGVTLRSNVGSARGKLIFLDSSGTNRCSNGFDLGDNQEATYGCANSAINSVMVDSDRDVSVLVANTRTSNYSKSAYTGLEATKATTTAYIPLVQRQANTASGTGNSEISIQNVNSTIIDVHVQFNPGPGETDSYNKPLSIAPYGTYRYVLDSETHLPTDWSGSAVVSSDSAAKLVVVSTLRFGADTVQTITGFPSSSLDTSWIIPLFTAKLTNGLNTPIAVQNLSGATINTGRLQLNCIADSSSPPPSTFTKTNDTNIASGGPFYFNPVNNTAYTDGWVGACRIISLDNLSVVTFVQMRYVGAGHLANAAAYEAMQSTGSAKQVIFPLVQKRLSDGSATAVTIQNKSGSAAHVTFKYQASCLGFSNVTVGPYTIPANGSIIHNHRLTGTGSGTGQHNLPDGWCGSLIAISSDQAIDGFIQLTNINDPAGDTFMAEDGTTRP